jgi:glycerol uptake facilitator-like aquaporin
MKNGVLQYLVELVGTFIFLSVIIITGNPLAIGLTLAAMAWFGGKVSGGHFNPAVNVMMLMDKQMTMGEFVGQTLAQLLGAVLAFLYYKEVQSK